MTNAPPAKSSMPIRADALPGNGPLAADAKAKLQAGSLTSTLGGLTYLNSTFDVTTAGGFVSIGSGPATPNVDNLGSFALSSAPFAYDGQHFDLLVTFTAPSGTVPGSGVFTDMLTGTVNANGGGVFIDFNNTPQSFNYLCQPRPTARRPPSKDREKSHACRPRPVAFRHVLARPFAPDPTPQSSLPMNTASFAKVKLSRFMWIQDFAARLAELGAPASIEALIELGKERLDNSREHDPIRDAESVWGEWQTES
jgi:hypothetical protein